MVDGAETFILAQARAGNRDAFRTLVERHSRAVFRVAYRVTGNEQDAEDVVQETFLKAYAELARFEARSGLARGSTASPQTAPSTCSASARATR